MQRTPKEQDVLIRSCMHVMEKYARKFASYYPGIPHNEFASSGLEALRLAALEYDESRGRFPPFARRFIVWKMRECRKRERKHPEPMLDAVEDAALRDDGGTPPAPTKAYLAMEETPEEQKQSYVTRNRFLVQRMAASALLVTDAPIDPESTYLAREEVGHAVDTMNRVIHGLPARDREIFRMHRIHDRQQDDVARAHGVSVDTVRRALRSVEDRLKEGLVAAGIESRERVANAWSRIRDVEAASPGA